MKNFPERVQRNGPAGRKKDKTERVIGPSRRTREEIVKWNQMTALRFQTGGDIRHPWPHFGGAYTVTLSLTSKENEKRT